MKMFCAVLGICLISSGVCFAGHHQKHKMKHRHSASFSQVTTASSAQVVTAPVQVVQTTPVLTAVDVPAERVVSTVRVQSGCGCPGGVCTGTTRQRTTVSHRFFSR